jgi:diketogulonate reductase-like aldo/keto reductase
VHYPFAVTGAEDYPNGDIALDHTVSLREVWAKCEALVDEGLIRHIGISNFPCLMVNDLLAYARIKPAVN